MQTITAGVRLKIVRNERSVDSAQVISHSGFATEFQCTAKYKCEDSVMPVLSL